MREETKARTEAIEKLKSQGVDPKAACKKYGVTIGAHVQALAALKGYAKPSRYKKKNVSHATIHLPEGPKADTKLILSLLELLTNEIRKLNS